MQYQKYQIFENQNLNEFTIKRQIECEWVIMFKLHPVFKYSDRPRLM